MVWRPLALASGLVLAGCASSTTPPDPVQPLVGPNEQVVETNYTQALECLASHVRAQDFQPPRIAVGHITDLTGASDYFTGRRITQGAALMAMTALADSGMRVIERYDMGVIEVELNYAQSGLVRDGQQTLREVNPGQLQGADLYIVGGITEFNPNVRSTAGELFVGGATTGDGSGLIGANSYTIDVGIDLRLVDVRSSEVLSVRSFRKQIIGRERSAGVFEFIGGDIVDFNIGQRALEPVQTAVRTMIDRSIYEFVAALYNKPVNACLNERSAHATGADGFARRGGDSEVLRPSSPTPPPSMAQANLPAQPEPIAAPAGTQVSVPVPSQSSGQLSGSTLASDPNGYALHLSTHGSRDDALAAWIAVKDQVGGALDGYRPILHNTPTGRNSIEYRLLAGPATDPATARQTCENLARLGLSCALYDPIVEEERMTRRSSLRQSLR